MGFSRQEYWSGLPVPIPGDLPDPGIESASLVSPALTGKFFTIVPPGKPEDNLGGTFKMELTQSPEPHQEGWSPLLNHPWCPGHSGRNWHHFRRACWGGGGYSSNKPPGGFTGKLHLTLTSTAWHPVPHPSPKRVSGILPGWAFIPFNREIGNEP